MRNVAADPSRLFEIDPALCWRRYRAARSEGPAIVGWYHSHPAGEAVPSPRDAASAAPDGMLWLIAAGRRTARVARGGGRAGRGAVRVVGLNVFR